MKKLLTLLPALLLAFTAQAQLFIDNNYTIDDMIFGFFQNSNVTISNVTYTGTQPSLAFFEGSQSNIGMNAGLLITTGTAENAVGPNDVGNKSATMNVPGSPWLDALLQGYTTFDAAVIELDVVPSTDTLCFKYVFGSEEYLEWVNTQFNDLFAFLVEGPGLPQGDSIWVQPDTVVYTVDSLCWTCVDTLIILTDTICWPLDSSQQGGTLGDTCFVYSDTFNVWCYPIPGCEPPLDTVIYPGYWYYSPGGVNIAQVPNTNLPVAINTLNHLVNSQYFVQNDTGGTVQYDAFTVPLWAKLVVQPGATYHVRIAIADAGDRIFDSGVFLGIESLGGDSLLQVEPEYQLAVNNNTHTVTFTNTTFWATKYHWDFGDGTTSDEKHPTHTFPGDGTYTVKLTASNWCSQETYEQQLQVGVSATAEPGAGLFRVWPNPTTDGAFTLDLADQPEAEVRIYSLDGRLLQQKQAPDGARIDLAAHGKGLYLLQVTTGGQTYTEKVLYR